MVNLKYKKIIILIPVILLIIFSIFAFFKFNQTKIHPCPKITPDSDNSINIVFTTDKEYSPYLKVALKSLILNKNKDSIYNIYILCIDLNKKIKQELKQFEQDKVKINTVVLKKGMLSDKIKTKVNIHYVSKADLFKIFIPEMFQNFDKILYLDSDILVLGDLSSLYNTDIQDKYIAAVKRYDFSPKLKKDLFNCGVMLYNNKKWQEDNISQKIVNTINENKKNTTITQYPFNKVIKKKGVKLISPLYNNIVLPEADFSLSLYKKNYSPFCDTIKDYNDLKNKTIIVHFAGIQKPWYNPDIEFAPLWWQYAHLINPYWKVEKRNIFKHALNSFAIVVKFMENKNFSDYIKNFYKTFKTS